MLYFEAAAARLLAVGHAERRSAIAAARAADTHVLVMPAVDRAPFSMSAVGNGVLVPTAVHVGKPDLVGYATPMIVMVAIPARTSISEPVQQDMRHMLFRRQSMQREAAAIPSVRPPACASDLPARHLRSLVREAVVAYGAPLAVMVNVEATTPPSAVAQAHGVRCDVGQKMPLDQRRRL